MSDWTYNHTNVARLKFTGITGQPALGFHLLRFAVDVDLRERVEAPTLTVTDISGKLWVRGKGNVERYLGAVQTLDGCSPLTTYPHSHSTTLQLEMEADPRRIQAIEELRMGENLAFRLDLVGMAFAQDGDAQRVVQSLHLQVNQSAWITVLDQIGYGRMILLEIPFVDEKVDPNLATAVEHLRTAQDHLLRGHYREAVGSCRDVLEAISTGLSDTSEASFSTVKKLMENQREMTKNQRVQAVRWAVINLAHPARHADPDSTRIEWGPEDARAVLTLTVALLQLSACGTAPRS